MSSHEERFAANRQELTLTDDLGVSVADIREWRERQFASTERERRALSKIDDLLGRIVALEAHEHNLEAHLHNLLVEVREELRQRRACLEGARDDLARIAGASVEDGGVWIKAVAESRLPLIDAAISETDKSLVVLGSFNVGL